MIPAAFSVTLTPILQNGFGVKGGPWEAVFLPVPVFPIPAENMASLRKLVGACRQVFLKRGQLPSEVFLQTNRLGKLGSARLARHAREWMPELGLGVWPDQPPPALPTAADFEDLGPQEKPRPMMYEVMQITGEASTKQLALAAMLGTGAVLEAVTPAGGETFLEQTKALLLPPIKEPGLRRYPFYVPILERKTLESAGPEQLDKWFCGASAYIRESAQDKGILIVSREPLTPLLEGLGGEFLKTPEPQWRIPC